MTSEVLSGLTFIDVKSENPFELFDEWKRDASKYMPTVNTLNVMNLATCSRDGDVSNRHVLVLRYEADGFIFLTDSSSRKVAEIKENPKVAATFLWRYSNEKSETVTKQVRIYGVLKEMDSEFTKEIFDSIPTFRKVRYHMNKQGMVVDWNDAKKMHDDILEEVKNGRKLEMPPYAISYKLTPSGMEFYYEFDNNSADRVLFTQQENKWIHVHLSP